MSVRLLEELTDMEKLALIPVSYSRLETFVGQWGCHAKYFYSYIVGEEDVFGAAAQLGTILHSVLEKELEPNQVITDDLLFSFTERYLAELEDNDPEQIINDTLVKEGAWMLSEFVDRHKGESFPVHTKELAFEIVIGSALVRGYIDRVDIEGDRVTITDYKSGKGEVATKHIAKNLQLGIYAMVAKKFFPGKEVYAQLYYLRSGKMKGHLFTDGDLLEFEDVITTLVDDLIYRQDYNPTDNYRVCYSCGFAKNGVCPTGEKRLRSRR